MPVEREYFPFPQVFNCFLPVIFVMHLNDLSRGTAQLIDRSLIATLSNLLTMRIKNIWLMLLLITGTGAAAQNTLLDEWSKKFPNDNAVYLKDEEIVTIDIAGDSLSITQEINNDILYLNDNAPFLNSGRVYYSYFTPLKSIDAKTLVPNEGNKYKTITVEKFEDVGEPSEGIFYDDSRSKSFVYPSLKKGARTILSYKKALIEPHLLPSFFFGSSFPVADSRLVIRANKNVKIQSKLLNTSAIDLAYSTRESGKYIEYIWEVKNLKGFEREEGAPSSRYYMPHIIYYIESYTTGKTEKPVLRNLDDLYAWDYSFVKKTINEEAPGLKALTDSITAGAATQAEKAKRIYYWVQDYVKYVAFEDGLRGFTPFSPMLVCDKRYGDCKDMASLLNSMLRMAGLKSHLVWIGTRDLPYKYSEIHIPGIANHMIAAIELGDSLVYLDGTSRYTMFGMPSAFIMGKEGLITGDEKSYMIKTVPVMSKDRSISVDSTSMKLEGKTLLGTGKLTLTGYKKSRNIQGLEGRKQDDTEKAIHALLEKGNNKYKTSSYTLHDLKDRDKPLVVDYSFTIEDYITSSGNEIYVNMMLDKYFQSAVIDTSKLHQPRENDYPVTYKMVNTMEIPAGYTLEYVPKNSNYAGKMFGYSISYNTSGNTVTAMATLYLDYLLMPTTSFQEWNDMIKKLKTQYRESIILKKQ